MYSLHTRNRKFWSGLQCVKWLSNCSELHRVFKAMLESIVREPLGPCLLLHMCVPVLPVAALAILVHPSGAIVPLPPCAIPSFPMPPFPPCFALLYSMAIWIKVFIPLVSPFWPTITFWPLCPLVGVFHATTITIVLLPPSVRNIIDEYNKKNACSMISIYKSF